MNKNALTRLILDAAMTIFLILLASIQVTGTVAHECIGTAIGVLFLVHTAINRRFFANLAKGRLTPERALNVLTIFLVIFDAVVVLVTGVMISGTVFSFLHISAGIAIARSLHLAAGFWGFALMGVHLGLHWGMVMGMTRTVFSLRKHVGASAWLLRAAAIALAAYGWYAAGRVELWGFLTLRNQFPFYDDQAGPLLALFNYTAALGFFVVVSYYLGRAVTQVARRKPVSA